MHDSLAVLLTQRLGVISAAAPDSAEHIRPRYDETETEKQ